MVYVFSDDDGAEVRPDSIAYEDDTFSKTEIYSHTGCTMVLRFRLKTPVLRTDVEKVKEEARYFLRETDHISFWK